MIGKIFVTSSGYDPGKGKDVKDPTWGRKPRWVRADLIFENSFRRMTTSSSCPERSGTSISS